jgi:hypothetical protein
LLSGHKREVLNKPFINVDKKVSSQRVKEFVQKKKYFLKLNVNISKGGFYTNV